MRSPPNIHRRRLDGPRRERRDYHARRREWCGLIKRVVVFGIGIAGATAALPLVVVAAVRVRVIGSRPEGRA